MAFHAGAKGIPSPKTVYDFFMNYLPVLYGLKYRIKAAGDQAP